MGQSSVGESPACPPARTTASRSCPRPRLSLVVPLTALGPLPCPRQQSRSTEVMADRLFPADKRKPVKDKAFVRLLLLPPSFRPLLAPGTHPLRHGVG